MSGLVEGSLPTKQISPMQLRTLVLNADYQPVRTWPLSLISAPEAITDWWTDKTEIIETWKDAFGNDILFRSPSISIPAPKVVLLKEYASAGRHPKFNRKNVMLRDRYRCQYCGKRADVLTWDHLIPRDAGGKTEWTNILTACSPCNALKGNRLPDWSAPKGSALRPLKEPRVPTHEQLIRAGMEFLSRDIWENWGDYLYWHVELDP